MSGAATADGGGLSSEPPRPPFAPRARNNKNPEIQNNKMASYYGVDNFFSKFLPLLGFQDPDHKILSNKELFVVPNKDAFQKVIVYFKSVFK